MFCFKKQCLRQEEGHARRQGPTSLMELPKLRLTGMSKLSSCSSPALRSVLGTGANGRVPVLRPLKCAAANKKVVRSSSFSVGLLSGLASASLSVCGSSSPDRHTEGHQTSPETLPPAHDQQERGAVLKSMPAHPPGEQGLAAWQAEACAAEWMGQRLPPVLVFLTMLGSPRHAALACLYPQPGASCVCNSKAAVLNVSV